MRRFLLTAIVVAAPLACGGIAEAQNFRAACRVDQLCAGVPKGGGGIMNCLRQHKSELTEQCYVAIGHRVINRRPGGHGGGGGGGGGEGAGGPPPGGAGEPPAGGAGGPPPQQ